MFVFIVPAVIAALSVWGVVAVIIVSLRDGYGYGQRSREV